MAAAAPAAQRYIKFVVDGIFIAAVDEVLDVERQPVGRFGFVFAQSQPQIGADIRGDALGVGLQPIQHGVFAIHGLKAGRDRSDRRASVEQQAEAAFEEGIVVQFPSLTAGEGEGKAAVILSVIPFAKPRHLEGGAEYRAAEHEESALVEKFLQVEVQPNIAARTGGGQGAFGKALHIVERPVYLAGGGADGHFAQGLIVSLGMQVEVVAQALVESEHQMGCPD